MKVKSTRVVVKCLFPCTHVQYEQTRARYQFVDLISEEAVLSIRGGVYGLVNRFLRICIGSVDREDLSS